MKLAPSTCSVSWATRVGWPDSNGRAPSWMARKGDADEQEAHDQGHRHQGALGILASGFLKAGTPSAIASTPVRAVAGRVGVQQQEQRHDGQRLPEPASSWASAGVGNMVDLAGEHQVTPSTTTPPG